MDLKMHWFCFLTLSLVEPAIVFTLEDELQSFEKVYKTIIDTLEVYVMKETARLNGVKLNSEHLIKGYESVRQGNLDDSSSIFKLIKGLTSDLHALESVINKRTTYQNASMNSSLHYPNHDHLNRAIFVLSMIQDTYGLNVIRVANGQWNVSFNPNKENYMQYSSPLNEHDCFTIGRFLCKEESYRQAVVWLQEALRRNKGIEHIDDFEANIFENLARAYYMLNDFKKTQFWVKKLIDNGVPQHQYEEVPEIIKEFNSILKAKKDASHNNNSIQYVMSMDEIMKSCLRTSELLYQKACRGETAIVNEIAKRLKCKYVSGKHPFLKLAPLKLEELYLDPDVYLFHNVINDHEIEHFNIISKSRFQACNVNTNTEPKRGIHQVRLCKSANLGNEVMSEEILKIRRRLTDITGMTMDYSTSLRVVKYWVGDYYGPHRDFWKNSTFGLGNGVGGNRIASVIIYLSSAGQGGATVFPHLGLNVYPVKGAALFWRNLYSSGEGDLDMIHASCPVIRGSKMIIAQWISSIGQELSFPCNLKDEHGWRENIKLPTLNKIMSSTHAEIEKGMQTCRRYDFSGIGRD